MDDTIGIWRGPFPGQLLDGRVVQPGDRVEVTEADLQSGHWDTSRAQTAPEPPLPPAAPAAKENAD